MAGWPILLLGLIGVPLAYGYTAPPLKLAYRGLGELNVFVLMGPMMVLGGFLVHRVAGMGVALTASVPIGCLVASILHANNLRDLDDDRALGKQTLATIVGPRWGKVEMLALLGGAYAALIAGVWLRVLPRPALLALLSPPAAVGVGKTVVRARRRWSCPGRAASGKAAHPVRRAADGRVNGGGRWGWLKRG